MTDGLRLEAGKGLVADGVFAQARRLLGRARGQCCDMSSASVLPSAARNTSSRITPSSASRSMRDTAGVWRSCRDDLTHSHSSDVRLMVALRSRCIRMMRACVVSGHGIW